jgi:NAD(P)-dependent dehydrogenase (short-subunit alcohol dehydrogenase family)
MSAAGARPVAFVTGGQRGIGLACGAALARRGFDVVVGVLDPADKAADAATAIGGAGGRSAVVHGDVANLDRHTTLLDAAWAAFGRLDCLVNNAGVSVLSRGDLLEVSAFARRLLATPSEDGHHRAIVFISSANATAISINRGEYCVSKAAAAMVAKLFAVRLAPHGVGVYDIRPGMILTEMTAPSKARYEAFFAAGGAAMPRWGEAAEVGRVVASVAAGELPYTVGQEIYVDGGVRLVRY